MKRRNMAAFTLLEVLIALAVLAIGLTATIISSIEITRNARHLSDKTMAHWVAENVLNQRSVLRLSGAKPAQQGEQTMDDTTWQWRISTQPALFEHIQQITVQVQQQGKTLATLSQFEYLPEASS